MQTGLARIRQIVLILSSIAFVINVMAMAMTGNTFLLAIYIRNQFLGLALMSSIIQLIDFVSIHHLFGPWSVILQQVLLLMLTCHRV